MAESPNPSAGSEIEARLARLEAILAELLETSRERAAEQQRLGRELVEERAKNLELQRRLLPAENALVSATLRDFEARAAQRAERLETLLGELLRRVEADSIRAAAGRVLRSFKPARAADPGPKP
jgi:hypothetical protein